MATELDGNSRWKTGELFKPTTANQQQVNNQQLSHTQYRQTRVSKPAKPEQINLSHYGYIESCKTLKKKN